MVIPSIKTRGGRVTAYKPEIIDEFKVYYETLYSTQTQEVEGEMWVFSQELEISHLTNEEREILDSPVALEELQKAVAALANKKSPGPDGFPVEIYKRYGEVLLPDLLRVFIGVMGEGRLPASMMETTIIVLPMKGRDPLNSSSYRPISLLPRSWRGY